MAKEAKDYREGLRSAYIPHERVSLDTGAVSCTRQEFAEECDINAIMARYEKVGGFLPPPVAEPRYLDLTQMPTDFQSAMHVMMEAENAFMSLPASVRFSFENDPARFVEFAMDGANLDKMREWGLAPAAAQEGPPMRVEVVNPTERPPEQPAKPAPSGGPAKATQ